MTVRAANSNTDPVSATNPSTIDGRTHTGSPDNILW